MNIDDNEIKVAQRSRQNAKACVFLSLIISAALLASNIGPDRNTENAITMVSLHKEILAENQSVLRNNQKDLTQILLALKSVEKVPSH